MRTKYSAAIISGCLCATAAVAQAPIRGNAAPADTIQGINDTITVGKSLSKCGETISRLRGAHSAAGWWKDIGAGMKVLGYAMKAAELAELMANQRKEPMFDAKAAQDLAEFFIDEAACAAAGIAVCPAWMAGRQIGQVFNRVPQLVAGTDRTFNDMWTDFLVEQYLYIKDSGFGNPTDWERIRQEQEKASERSIFRSKEPKGTSRQGARLKPYFEMQERLKQAERVAAARQLRAEEEMRRTSAAATTLQCSIPEKDDETLQAAIDAMNGKVSAAIGQSARQADGLGSAAEHASSLSRTGVAEAARGADQQLQGMINSTSDASSGKNRMQQFPQAPSGAGVPSLPSAPDRKQSPVKRGCWRDIPGDCP